MFETKIVEKI